MRYLIVLISLSISFASAEECLLKGMWQSNKEKTLASIDANGVVLTEPQKKLLLGDFFGKLVIDNHCSSYITYLDGIVDGGSEHDAEIVREDEVSVTVRYEEFGEIVERTLTLVEGGNCYTVPLGKLGFNEYFCRLQ